MTTYDESYSEITKFPEMIGKTMSSVECKIGAGDMTFRSLEGSVFNFYHHQDCCERVEVADIIGDIADLIGSPIVEAEEVSSAGFDPPEHPDSYTWTFYRFSTAKGTVTVRWLGESNGYYSEAVTYTVEAA